MFWGDGVKLLLPEELREITEKYSPSGWHILWVTKEQIEQLYPQLALDEAPDNHKGQ